MGDYALDLACVDHAAHDAVARCEDCGDPVCAKCREQYEGRCRRCESARPARAKVLPTDLDHKWIVEAAYVLWKSPWRTLSQLGDGRTYPAFKFAMLTNLLVTFALRRFLGESLALRGASGDYEVFLSPFGAALAALATACVQGTLHAIGAKVVGAPIKWTLSLRAAGYAFAYFHAITLIEGLLLVYVSLAAADRIGFVLACVPFAQALPFAFAFYAIGRGRGGLSVLRASLAAAFATLPFSILLSVLRS